MILRPATAITLRDDEDLCLSPNGPMKSTPRGRQVKGADNMPGRRSGSHADSPISHADVWRLAIPLIDAHGDGAVIRAAELSDESFNAGDLDSWHLWLQVMTAVEQFQSQTPLGAVH